MDANVRWRYDIWSPNGEVDDWQDDEAEAFRVLRESLAEYPDTRVTRYIDTRNPETGYWETNTLEGFEQWQDGKWVAAPPLHPA